MRLIIGGRSNRARQQVVLQPFQQAPPASLQAALLRHLAVNGDAVALQERAAVLHRPCSVREACGSVSVTSTRMRPSMTDENALSTLKLRMRAAAAAGSVSAA